MSTRDPQPPRRRSPRPAHAALLLVALAAWPGAPLRAQVPGVSREEMWFAPTAEDWARPCLVTFQRTYEDALAVSRETGKPLLVCVNMDGEIASEHYAGIRYRRPETAALYEPYVCVIASVYRHTPRDFDDDGQRIPCPRFGSVTCGEHVAIEPGLFERFLDGTRVAPRHIGVELDGSEMYDVYYAFDTDSVFETLREGVADRPATPEPVRSDRPLAERVESHHAEDREAVEAAYLAGDRATRRELLERSIALDGEVSVDLLRLAIYGLDADLAGVARRGLVRSRSAKAVPLIAEALRVPMPGAEREALLGTLDAIGETVPRARAVAVVHRGLEQRSQVVDEPGWREALAGAEGPGDAAPELEQVLETAAAALARAAAEPDEAGAQLDFALAALALALGRDGGRYEALWVRDAEDALTRALELGAGDWRVPGARALLELQAGRPAEARELAAAAVEELPAGRAGPAAAELLYLFAQQRQRAIQRAYVRGEALEPAWMTDVHAAYGVLARHPYGTAVQAADHYDFLRWFGAGAAADGVLDEALARFPDAFQLHDRLRARILKERGADDLEAVYRDVLSRAGASPNLEWFAGYTSIVSAEFHRRGGREQESRAAYGRAIEHFDASAAENPETETSSAHYAAVALAGRARLELEAGELDAALADVLACFERSPHSAATLDGLNVTPVGTAQMLHARLVAAHRGEDALVLGEALDRLGALDPRLLELPAFEQGGGGNRRRSWPARQR